MIEKKNIIERNFSKYAEYYDSYSSIQNICASELIQKISADSVNRILDIGCGTGNYTKLLRERFPSAEIKAVDISDKMVDMARKKLSREKIEFIVADAEKADFEEKFDLISSNAAFQWFEDLRDAVMKYKNMLNDGGLISFSTFGPLTFYELDASLKELAGRHVSISSFDFMEMTEISDILREFFKKVSMNIRIYSEDFESVSELLKKIKYTGTRGNSSLRKDLWTRKTMSCLEEIYKNKFGNIRATYQVFFCRGVK